MTKLQNISLLLLILALLALPMLVQAQDDTSAADTALVIPAVLSMLIGANYRATEAFKIWMVNPRLPFTPDENTRPILTILFSIGFGIASVWATPTSTDWLMPEFANYPLHAIVLTGFAVSAVGGIVWQVMSFLGIRNSTKVSVSTSNDTQSVKAEIKPQA